MKKLRHIFLLLSLCIFMACDEEEAMGPTYTDPNPDDVEIRIDNQSKYTLKDLHLNTGSDEHSYKNIRSGKKSNYQNFRYAYPTFSLSFQVGTKQFEYIDSLSSNYNRVEAGQYDAIIYAIDSVLKTFSFRLEES